MSDINAQLARAITTASNDDMTKPGSDKRERHVQRLTAMTDAADEIARLRALNAMAREALRSFARLALDWPDDESGDYDIAVGTGEKIGLTIEDLRRARRALAEIEKEQDHDG